MREINDWYFRYVKIDLFLVIRGPPNLAIPHKTLQTQGHISIHHGCIFLLLSKGGNKKIIISNHACTEQPQRNPS